LSNQYFIFFCRVIVSAIFIVAAVGKLSQPAEEFTAIVRAWQILPEPIVTWYALALPWVEFVAGITLLLGFWQRWSAALVALMLLSFLIAAGINISRGLVLENCGCFGELIKLGETFQDLFWRDVVFFILTLFIMFAPASWLSLDRYLERGNNLTKK